LPVTGSLDARTRDYINGEERLITLPPVSTYDSFAQCVTGKGATLYNAFLAPFSQSIKTLFGSSMRYIIQVEFSTSDGSGQTQLCANKNITGYPTWIFADGTRIEGQYATFLEDLSKRTSCPLPNSNSAITISGASGPQELGVGQQGTWTVNASDSNRGN